MTGHQPLRWPVPRILTRSLAARILALFIIAIVAPLIVALVRAQSDALAAEGRAVESARSVANAASINLSNLVQYGQYAARTVSLLPAFWDGEDTDRDRILKALASSQSVLNSLLYITPDLQQHGHSHYDPERGRPDLTQRASAIEARATGQIAFENGVLSGRTRGVAVTPFVIPIHDASDPTRSGFLNTAISVERLSAGWADLPLPQGSTVLLVDTREGRILAGTGPEASRVNTPIAADALAHIRAGETSFRLSQADGPELLRTWALVDGTPWVLIVDVPRAAVLGPVYADLARRVAVNLLVAAVVLALLLVLWRQLSGRLQALRSATVHWSRSDWGYRTGIRGDDELGQLGTAFDAMAQQLQEQADARRLAEENARRLLVEQARVEERNRALERASRAKSEFLATMSHELRTPLNSIIGFSDLLLDDLSDDPAARVRSRYVSNIHDSGRHLLGLVNEILDLVQVEAGRMPLHPTTFSVAATLDTVVEGLWPLAENKGLTLAQTLDPDLPPLHTDEGRFKQVLYNLLSNAVKFTPEGGRVETIVQRLDEVLQVTVADTGPGIAPEDQTRVFEPFEQVDSSARRQHQGTGLGLALTKRLVALLGGRIWLESAPGEGSRFHFTMPLAPLSPPSEPPAERDPAAGREPAAAAPDPVLVGAGEPDDRPTILVVEDDRGARELLRAYLEQEDYRVVAVPDGTSLVELACRLRPSAISLDVILPGSSGWELLQQLKADPATADIPVLIMSALDAPGQAQALGAAAHLVKPIARDDVLDTLSRLCRAPAALSSVAS